MIATAQCPLGVPLPVTHEPEKHPDSQVLLLPARIRWQRSGIGSAVSSIDARPVSGADRVDVTTFLNHPVQHGW